MRLKFISNKILYGINYFLYLAIIMKELQSKGERTRQFIIEKTAPIFNSKGYAGTYLSDLEKATGLSKGGIYCNFENKDDVALAVFDYNFGRVNDYVAKHMLAHQNAVDRLLVYPQIYRDFLKISFLQPGCPILNTSTEADDTHPQLKAKAANALQYWKKAIENQVKRGIERKEIKSDTKPSEVAVIIMSLIEGAIMQAKVTNKSTELRIAMDFLEKIIVQLKA
jgi:TetR/AcrR family transcriptional repressor of nem operon